MLEWMRRAFASNDKSDCSAEQLSKLLQEAAAEGHIKEVKQLLERGADVNAPPTPHAYGPLDAAAASGHTEVVRLLLDRGGDANYVTGGRTALIAAATFGHTKVAKLLLDRGAEVNARSSSHTDDGWTALQWAVETGYTQHAAVIALLKAHGGTM